MDGTWLGTPFQFALRNGSINAARVFLDAGVNPKQRDRWGQSMLTLVAVSETQGSSQVELVKMLIKAGVDVNSVDQVNRTTPLHWAANKGNAALTEVILKHGADVAAVDDVGCTALHRAAQVNSIEVVKLLLAHGADASARMYPIDSIKGDKGSIPLELSDNQSVREMLRAHVQAKKDSRVIQ